MTKEYAEARSRWEPLYETSQIKGDGETHPSLSPDDEFADYETWDTGNLTLTPKKAGMLQYEYTREALKNGLGNAGETGYQPLQIRPRQWHRHTHRPDDRGGGQFLRQALRGRTLT